MTIWTYATQVMAKRKVGSQIGNLTTEHQRLKIDLTLMRVGGVQQTIGKLLMRTTTLL
jgi:hypothetical protein